MLKCDSPAIFDASITNIPAVNEAPLEVISSHQYKTNRVHVIDAIGQYMEILIGPPGQEMPLHAIGNRNEIYFAADIPKGARVSIRSLSTRITSGTLILTFKHGGKL